MGRRALARRRSGALLAAHKGELDRGWHKRGTVEHHRQAPARTAGRIATMALVLDEQQAMLQESARNFLADKAPVAHLRKLRDSRDGQGFAAMGFCGVLVPEEHGGLGLGNVEAGTIMEEIGRNLTPSPFLSTAIVGVSA